MMEPPERYVAYFLGMLRKLHLWKGLTLTVELPKYNFAIYKLVDRHRSHSRERT